MLQSAQLLPSEPLRESLALGLPALKLLAGLARYPYLTAEQATRLLYSPGSFTFVWDNLHKLTKAGYVLQAGRKFGFPPLYVLSRKGANFVTSTGGSVRLWRKPSDLAEKQFLFLLHTMSVNDQLISLERLARSEPRITLGTVLHDVELKRQPWRVTLPTGKSVRIIPDYLAELLFPNSERFVIAGEIDRGMYEEKRWRQKIRTLVAFLRVPGQTVLNTGNLGICIHAIPGEARREQLWRWTAAELTALHAQNAGFRFWFTDADAQTTDPRELWCAASWYVPFYEQPQTFLPLEGAGAS